MADFPQFSVIPATTMKSRRESGISLELANDGNRRLLTVVVRERIVRVVVAILITQRKAARALHEIPESRARLRGDVGVVAIVTSNFGLRIVAVARHRSNRK